MTKKLFVKKFKFIGPVKSPRSGAKGFSGFKNGSKPSNTSGVATSVSRIEEVDDGKTVVSQNLDSLPSDREKIEEKLGSLHINTSAGSESSEERLSPEIMKSIKSNDLDTRNSKIFTKENREAKTKSDKSRFNQSGFKTDPWWLKLPYVLELHEVANSHAKDVTVVGSLSFMHVNHLPRLKWL
ncbi:hypothetical protein GQ457_12G005640 [Hibiscus cannabinus]